MPMNCWILALESAPKMVPMLLRTVRASTGTPPSSWLSMPHSSLNGSALQAGRDVECGTWVLVLAHGKGDSPEAAGGVAWQRTSHLAAYHPVRAII